MRLPNDQQRTVIVGKTGSGKTVAGVWHLSQQNILAMPWIVFDWKRDGLIAQIGAIEIDVKAKVPNNPGVYAVRPMPNQEAEVNDLLWRIWARGNCGVFIDEGYMIGDSEPFRAILTQGRSKHIPLITLSQRPVWMSRFVFSEADFFQVFWLNDKRDRKTVASFIPEIKDERLPDYHSYYYDVGKDDLMVLRPVPSEDQIIESFAPKQKSRLLLFT